MQSNNRTTTSTNFTENCVKNEQNPNVESTAVHGITLPAVLVCTFHICEYGLESNVDPSGIGLSVCFSW